MIIPAELTEDAMQPLIDIEHTGPVATVWMNRPEVHNAFNEDLIAQLTQAFADLGTDERVRVVVLAGRGRSFSAGGDLAWMKRLGEASVAANVADAERLATLFRTIAECPKPTVARVHGAALAGGTGLVAACDMAVAAERAQFAVSEVRLGLIPATIGPYVLRAIGARQAGRYFQTAERIDARRALALGLVHEVVADDDALDTQVAEIVHALLQGAPGAQTAAKALIRDVSDRPVTDALVHDTAERIARLRALPEAQEGLSAFLEKRPAAWVPKESHV
jgi:methylglutaconyl-CoA hydratase